MQSTSISRLYETEIANGRPIDATHIDGELDQLIAANNNQHNDINDILNNNITIAGNKTLSGTITLSHATSPLKTDKIEERTPNNGINIDGLIVKDNRVRPVVTADSTLDTNGDFAYQSTLNNFRGRVSGTVVVIPHGVAFKGAVLRGCRPEYNAANIVDIPVGCVVADNGVDIIEVTITLSPSLATSGANGLDTGAEAANTWYYLWLIKKSSDGTVAALWSASRTAPTMPSGYDTKCLLPFAARNDGSSNIIPFKVIGSKEFPFIAYNTTFDKLTWSNTTTAVLSGGTSASYVDVNCSSFVPPISRRARLFVSNSVSATMGFKEKGASVEIVRSCAGNYDQLEFDINTDTAQVIQYKTNAGNENIAVVGFYIDNL